MTTAPLHCPVTDLDPWSDDVLADPFPTYKALRDLGPVVWLERYGIAALPRFAEVRAALTDYQRFSSAAGVCVDEARAVAMGESILTSDPPVHDRYRKPLANQLSVAALADDVAPIEAIADSLVASLVAAGSFDAVADAAAPFSVRVVGDLLGLPDDERRAQIGPWGERAFNTMGPADARHLDGLSALAELADYSVGVALSGQLCPGSRGAALVANGDAGAVMAYTWPGIDTTVHALGAAVLAFAEQPEQWQRVRENPSLVPSAFNEVLRLHAPVQIFTRVTTETVTIGEVELPARQRVAVLFGSANRDERRYPAPDTFDVGRNPTDQLSFGRGIHLCVGINLARIEAHALLGAFARRVARFDLDGPPRWKLNNTLHGLASLPVRVTPG